MGARTEPRGRGRFPWPRWLGALVAITLGWFLLERHALTLTTMGSNSMQPTLYTGKGGDDVVLVDRWTNSRRDPRRGEIVHFRSREDGDWVLKRVVALPGETLELRDGRVWIDGARLTEPPAVATRTYETNGHLGEGVRLKMGPRHYFVLGDDTADSYDSRFWGALERREITGIARAIAWPPARVRGL